MQQQTQSKDQIMKKSALDNKCTVCNGTNYEIFQAWELAEIDTEKYKETIERHIEVYSSLQVPSQGYAIPCRRCNGGYAQRVQVSRGQANIPSNFYDKHIEDFDRNIYRTQDGKPADISKMMQAVDSFIQEYEKWDKRGFGLYICSGMKGSGKTFLASCICNSLIQKYPMNTKFVSASQLLNISKNSDGSGNYTTDQLSLLCKCKLLVIDDIGQKNCGSDWMNDVLFQIIDYRYQQKLVTIFTSNVKVVNLDLDDRIVDRINKMTFQMSLPEYCVRAKEANEQKTEFMKELGIM